MESENRVRQIAILLSSLPKTQLSRMLAGLDRDESDAIAAELTRLGQVDNSERHLIARTFVREVRSTRTSIPIAEGTSFIKEPVSESKEVEPGHESAEPGEHSDDGSTAPRTADGEFLSQLTTSQLAELVKNEDPFSIAVIIIQLSTEDGAKLLARLPMSWKVSVIRMIAARENWEAASFEPVLARIKSKRQSDKTDRLSESIGVELAADLLESLDEKVRQQIIRKLAKIDPSIAGQIDRSELSFGDLAFLSIDETRTLLSVVDTSHWAPAMKKAGSALINRVFSSMAIASAQILQKEIDDLLHCDNEDVVRAQTAILDAAKRLHQNGTIEIKSRSRAA